MKNVNKKARGGVALVAVAALLAACGTTSNQRGLTAGNSPDPMFFIAVYSSNGGFASPEQYKLSTLIAGRTCKMQVDGQIAKAEEVRLDGARRYGMGYAGAGLLQGAYPFATPVTALAGAAVNGATGVVGGRIYGDVLSSENRAVNFDRCMTGAIDNWRRGDDIDPAVSAAMGGDKAVREALKGLTVSASWTGTYNTSAAPAWSGPRVGTTRPTTDDRH